MAEILSVPLHVVVVIPKLMVFPVIRRGATTVEVTWGARFVIVTAPVAPEIEIAFPAMVEETNAEPKLFCFALKIVQSAA